MRTSLQRSIESYGHKTNAMLRRWFKKLKGKFTGKHSEKKEKLYAVGLVVVQEYINSRKFRRQLKDSKLEKLIHVIMKEWNLKNKK